MITVEQVRSHLGIAPDNTDDDEWLTMAVGAVNVEVAGYPLIADRDDPTADWPANATTGAVMLAAHLYHSRNASQGRATFDITQGFQSAYADPEINRLLRIRRYGRPMMAGPTGATT